MQLLERTPFLGTLGEYATEARRGDGRLVLVSGESGIGKTALLDAFQHEQPETRWLWGACDGLFTPRPLGPLFDIGAQLDAGAGELAALCRQGAARDRLFAALLAELDTHNRLTIVVIEDVHWADEATIDLLSFVGRRLARRAALVLVTYRDDELGEDHPLRRALGDLATQRTTRRMRLAPLSQDAVRTLAAGRDVDIAELHRITGGNPFYVSEILDAGWPSVPPTVRDAVGARMARLTPAARAATELAAVMGARLPGSLVSSVVGDSDATVTECLASGLLVPDGSGLRFRHELARMAVEAGIAPHRKAELHGRLLGALESDGGADAALLAHHAEGSGDRDAVLRHAPDAARRASALGAHRESAAQYERAIRFADDLEPAALAALHEGIAGEHSLLDRWEESELARRAALRLRREARSGYQAGLGRIDPWTLGSVAVWQARLRAPAGIAANLPEPYDLEIGGHAEQAAQAWDKIGRPYDAAIVRLQSSQEDPLRQAITTFEALGAEAARARARRRMKELGIGNIPRGPRPGTRSAPGGLTAREQEVLALLTEGLQDREISQRLVISERTVHHHVSAILAKIGVTSRSAAVRAAARMGTGTPNLGNRLP